MNPLTACVTDHPVETVIKEWLKYAKERCAGRRDRKHKQQLKNMTKDNGPIVNI